jgi:hypothetical protein
LPGQGITQKWLVGAAIDAGMGADLQSDGFIDPTGATSADFVGLVCTTNGKSTFAVGDVADVIVFGRAGGYRRRQIDRLRRRRREHLHHSRVHCHRLLDVA